jgi:hypothetical protein
MSTQVSSPVLEAALAKISKKFRERLIPSYLDLKRNCLESRHEAAGMSMGRFCEVVLRHLQDKIHGSFVPFGKKIDNFADECRKLVVAPPGTATESERTLIPRALVYVYTMRNKRGIGHVGGDIDANGIDVATMARVSDWVVCELVRINHNLPIEEAQDILDGISVRQLPIVWQVAGKKRILKKGLSAKDQTLILLYSSTDTSVFIEDLFNWIEYSNLSVYKSKVLTPLHKERFLEFDKDDDVVVLSPLGTQYVEGHLLGSADANAGS